MFSLLKNLKFYGSTYLDTCPNDIIIFQKEQNKCCNQYAITQSIQNQKYLHSITKMVNQMLVKQQILFKKVISIDICKSRDFFKAFCYSYIFIEHRITYDDDVIHYQESITINSGFVIEYLLQTIDLLQREFGKQLKLKIYIVFEYLLKNEWSRLRRLRRESKKIFIE
ncbi:unnamed protein product [Paramecium sonneborni]|uniref:Uncharacterized protein n=1 Tax=Paramecium sonneborni TaxID=65129 RepID=A0A8S1MHB0_9CILI|nr:unnamed protein product [Paramecium sonneborni]